MKASEMVSQMIHNSEIAEASVCVSFCDENLYKQFDRIFGQGEVEDILGEITPGEYVAQYSESREFFDDSPDAILIRADDKCIFLYKIQ